MSDKTVLTDEQKAQFVADICNYGTGFVAPLFAVIDNIERAVIAAAMPGQVEASDPEAKGNISAWLRRRAGNDMVMIPGRLAGQIADHIDALKSASVSEQKGEANV